MTGSEEYTSLRQEIIEHQGRRQSILALAATAAAALLAAGINSDNPLMILAVLPLLFTALIQITHIHYSIQRIAAYIRVIYEENSSELNWETASYLVRSYSVPREPSQYAQIGKGEISTDQRNQIRNVSSMLPMEMLLFSIGIIAGAAAIYVSFQINAPLLEAVSILAIVLWFGCWLWFRRRWDPLHKMDIEDFEANAFRQLFRSSNNLLSNQRDTPPSTNN